MCLNYPVVWDKVSHLVCLVIAQAQSITYPFPINATIQRVSACPDLFPAARFRVTPANRDSSQLSISNHDNDNGHRRLANRGPHLVSL